MSALTEELGKALSEIDAGDTFVARALVLGDDVDSVIDWIDLAADLRQADRLHGSLLVYESSEGVFPNDRYLWNNRGVLLRTWERYDEALNCFENALAIEPGYVNAMEGRAECHKIKRDYPAASKAYRVLFEHTDGTAEAWDNYAQCLTETDDRDDAFAAYKQSLSLDPQNTHALFNIAAHLSSVSDFGAALESVDALLGISPEDAEAQRLREEILSEPAAPTATAEPPVHRDSTVVRDSRQAASAHELRKLVERGLVTAADLEPLPPVVFLSYRWGTAEEDAWVADFAADLSERGYDVVFDRDVQSSSSSPVPVVELVALMLTCNWFVPILTEPYRRRVDKLSATVIEDGWVFDEYQTALLLGGSNRLTFKGIWRSGAVVPLPFRKENVCDFREDMAYGAELARAFPRCMATVMGIRADDSIRSIGPVDRKNVQTVGQKLERTGEFEQFVIEYRYEEV